MGLFYLAHWPDMYVHCLNHGTGWRDGALISICWLIWTVLGGCREFYLEPGCHSVGTASFSGQSFFRGIDLNCCIDVKLKICPDEVP